MRNVVILILVFVAQMGWAQTWEDRRVFNAETASLNLRILSSTDTDLFAPLIESFISEYPGLSVEYLVSGTSDIDKRFRADPAEFDIVISSAMDLQFKLANDGFALKLKDIKHPDWATWRDSLFAFTSEPAAIVINKAAFEGLGVPNSRQELIEALRARPEMFRARVATYDVRQSGLGYLFATQDARSSETYWRLMEVMGGLDVRMYCCSGAMIDDLMNGTIAVAYNVLGSYAAARTDSTSALQIIFPSDFPTVMMRTAFISVQSQHREEAELFIRHLISQQSAGQHQAGALPPLNDPAHGEERASIAMEPALLTFLDALKRKKFLSEWENALIHD